jgi:PadR family transcriptional regulator PadR
MGKPSDLVQGTLDLLILKTISLEPMHGWAIAKRIQQVSGEVLQVQQGSLYPALHRLEQQAWIKANWAESETGRQAKFYSLTNAGREQLEPSFGRHQPGRRRSVTRQGPRDRGNKDQESRVPQVRGPTNRSLFVGWRSRF